MATQYSIKTSGDGGVIINATPSQLNELVGGSEISLHSHAGGGGSTLTVAETEVFNGTSPNPSAWTDLDLSGVVGANLALVYLKFNNSLASIQEVAFRPNGDADESFAANTDGSASCGDIAGSKFAYFLVATDAGGVVEWQYEAVGQANVTIDVVAYIV